MLERIPSLRHGDGLGRAEVGGPVVSMWWEMLCLTGASETATCVSEGRRVR